MENIEILDFLIGSIFASAICVTAYRLKFLSSSGSWAAVFLGTLIYGLGGLRWAILIVIFFLSSSIIPLIRSKLGFSVEKHRPKRNWKQVLVNGAPGLVILVINLFLKADFLSWTVYGGMIAAVTADTWATEIGLLSKAQPRLITTWKKVNTGTSGAVSLLGFGAAFSGSVFIGIIWYLMSPSVDINRCILPVIIGGFIGMLVDSILGATVQAQYFDADTQEVAETVGEKRERIRGWRWVDNDIVNLVCSLAGGFTAFLLSF